MTMRQLTDEERTFTEKIKEKRLNKVDALEGDVKILEFKLNFELDHSLRKDKANISKLLSETQNKLADEKAILEIIDDQLTNGVPVKEKVEQELAETETEEIEADEEITEE